MRNATKTFRVFVSSTFSDLHMERRALQEHVFPRLDELCIAHGARFQAIDLRWGISEEAAHDQQTMSICLEEIERCQQTTPRPNFIILLGDRYGWRPLPNRIAADEFEAICRYVTHRDQRRLLEEWYLKDANAIPAEYRLKAREGRYADAAMWSKVESKIRASLLVGVNAIPLDPEARRKYVASAIEQEVMKGALSVTDAQEHVYCFVRSINGLPRDRSATRYIDLDDYDQPHSAAKVALRKLKQELRDHLADNVYEYTARWMGGEISDDHLPKLCEDVFSSLAGVIEKELAHFPSTGTLDSEVLEHDRFGTERATFFVGRSSIRQRIRSYIGSSAHHPLVISGAPGSGKTTLIARAVAEAREHHPRARVVSRFIGASPSSSDAQLLLGSLCRQLAREFQGSESAVGTAYRDLVKEFPEYLQAATAERPVIIFVDGLDQLGGVEPARNLAWLPFSLPEHVSMVVSTLPGEYLQELQDRLEPASFTELEPMSGDEGEQLLDLWLEEAQRRLEPHQRTEVLAKFERDGLPLYLQFAFQVARRWTSYTPQSETVLSPHIPGVIRDLFVRLSSDANHGAVLVSHALGYLATAKSGLSEGELLDLLSSESIVMDDFRARSPQSPEVAHLPTIIWSRLYVDLEPYLTYRNADGASLMTFFHRQLGQVVAEVYLLGGTKRKRHRALARYFANQPLDTGGSANLRKLSELPFQETLGELWNELSHTLTDVHFLECKVAAVKVENRIDQDGNVMQTRLGVFALEDDLDLALGNLREWATDQPRAEDDVDPIWTTLHDVRRLLSREAHNFLRWNTQTNPAYFAQQMHNRAYDLGMRPLAEEFRRRLDQLGRSSLMLSWRAGPGSELQEQTLTGHTEIVTDIAIIPGGERAVSASNDHTLRIWDIQSGRELYVLDGHTSYVNAVAVTSDGLFAVSASEDHTLRIWDLETGRTRSILKGHAKAVTDVALTRDGRRAISCSLDGTLRTWEMETGRELRVFQGHEGGVSALAITGDGRHGVSGSDDCTVRVWDLETGQTLQILRGHEGAVTTVALTADGLRAISGSYDEDYTLRVWDTEHGQQLASSSAHYLYRVDAVATLPEGYLAVSSSLWDPTIRVWDLENGQLIYELERYDYLSGTEVGVQAFAMKGDGRLLAASYADAVLKIWHLGLMTQSLSIVGQSGARTLAIDDAGQYVVSGEESGNMRIWDLTLVGNQGASEAGHRGGVEIICFTPDGRHAISASEDQTIKIWTIATGREVHTLRGHKDRITTLALTPDGRRIVSGSWDRTVKVWDLGMGRELHTLHGHEGYVSAVVLTPDGQRAVSASWDHTVRIWDVVAGRELHTLHGHEGYVWEVVLTPDGRRAVSTSADHTMRIWDLESGRELHTMRDHSESVGRVVVSTDGRFAVTAGAMSTVKVWDLASGTAVRTLAASNAHISRVLAVAGGYCIASEDDLLLVWDLETGRMLYRLGDRMRGIMQAVALSADGRYAIAAWVASSRLKMWDIHCGELLAIVDFDRDMECLSFSPSDELILAGDSYGNVYCLHTSQGREEPSTQQQNPNYGRPIKHGVTEELKSMSRKLWVWFRCRF